MHRTVKNRILKTSTVVAPRTGQEKKSWTDHTEMYYTLHCNDVKLQLLWKAVSHNVEGDMSRQLLLSKQ